MRYWWRVFFLLLVISVQCNAQVLKVQSSKIQFTSKTLLEQISAYSTAMIGFLDVTEKKFAFRVNMQTFMGFNSELQRQHFLENYIESELYPQASFKGSIVEDIAKLGVGKHKIRAKGEFTVHGISQFMVLPVEIVKDAQGGIAATCTFDFLLNEYKISIPRIVSNKLSNSIQVNVTCSLK